MSLHAHARNAAAIVALGLTLAACTKPEEPAAPAIPAGNAQAPLSAADCDRLADPAPADDSPTGKATAVSQGIAARAARAACKKAASAPQGQSNEDLARMRQIMEKQEADRQRKKISDEEYARRVKEAARAPVKEYKY